MPSYACRPRSSRRASVGHEDVYKYRLWRSNGMRVGRYKWYSLSACQQPSVCCAAWPWPGCAATPSISVESRPGEARRGAGALHLAARPAAEAVRPAHRRRRRVYLLVYGYRQPARCTGASCGDAFRLRGMWRCRQWRRQIQGRYGTVGTAPAMRGGRRVKGKRNFSTRPS